jgi:hypothetical protein
MAPVPDSLKSPWVRLALVVVIVAVLGLAHPSVTDLPGFSDQTGPTSASIAEFERVDEGCNEDVATFAGSSNEGDDLTRTTFVETGGPNASLSAWIERTSPEGADLSMFRVHVDAHGGNASSVSCEYGVQYRITVTTSGGSPQGLFPDAHGLQVLWLENGEYDGCSSSVTSPLDAECNRFAEIPERTWANATA